ncbi:hypothetical protein Tco_1306686 [Tanacetum coccineum]
MAKKSSIPAVDLSADDDNIEDEEDVVMTTTAPTQTFVLLDTYEEKLLCEQRRPEYFGLVIRGKKFASEHGWRVLKKHLKWDAADHFDSEDHTEIFGPDARPRPPGKTRPAKKTKSKTTESSAGSGSGSMKDVLNEELRQKIQAGKSAYEAKKFKEQ